MTSEGRVWPQILAAITATFAAFVTCFHTGWPAPFLPKLLSPEYPFDVTNAEASYITIISPVGNIIGGFFAASILDVIGRKKTILLIAIPQFVGFLLIYLSYHAKELLYVARIIAGLSEGMAFSIIPLYIGEIAEAKIRGSLGTLMSITCITGILVVNVVGSYLSIKVSALIFMVFPVIFLGLFCKMPESPYWLLMKNRTSDAEAALKFLRRKTDIKEELTQLTKDVARQISESGTYRDIFIIDSNRKSFFIVITARICQQLTGITAFNQYIQVLIKASTDSISPQLGSSIVLLVQLLMCLVASYLVDKFGRKPLLIFSISGMFLDLLVSSGYFVLKEHFPDVVDLEIIDWFPLFMMILYVVLFSVGLGSIINILAGEFFSASVKPKAVCASNVIFALSMMGSVKFYQATADAYGLAVPYVSFTLFSFCGILFFACWFPETKGKTLEEIQQQLKRRKSAKI